MARSPNGAQEQNKSWGAAFLAWPAHPMVPRSRKNLGVLPFWHGPLTEWYPGAEKMLGCCCFVSFWRKLAKVGELGLGTVIFGYLATSQYGWFRPRSDWSFLDLVYGFSLQPH